MSSLTSVFWSCLFSKQPGSDVLITEQKVALLSQKKPDKPRKPGPAPRLRGRVPAGLSVSCICLPLAHQLPVSHSPLSGLYLGCPGTFSLVYFFPCAQFLWMKVFPLTPAFDTPFLWKQTLASRAQLKIAGGPGQLPGRPASLCGAGLQLPGVLCSGCDPGKESWPKELTSVKTKLSRVNEVAHAVRTMVPAFF